MLHQWVPRLTKRDLGTGYILGTGVGLIASLAAYFLLLGEPFVDTALGTLTAIGFAAALLSIGVWLYRSGMDDEVIWTVAQWSSVGLAIPVCAGVLLATVRVRPPMERLAPQLFVNTIAAGAVLGLLIGTVQVLRSANETAQILNERNQVLNRVLRHNLRNDMGVILGYVGELESGDGSNDQAAYHAIYRKIDEIVELSEAARRLQHLDEDGRNGPVDLAGLVERRIEQVDEVHEDVTFEVETDDQAWASVGPAFSTAIDDLLENAIEHGGSSPNVSVSVGRTRGEEDTVDVVVRDDGPGIPDQEVEALAGPWQSPLQHGSGLGLWLAKWVAEHYDGRISVERTGPDGCSVRLSVPAASRMERLVGL